jgi:hypothetical protein
MGTNKNVNQSFGNLKEFSIKVLRAPCWKYLIIIPPDEKMNFRGNDKLAVGANVKNI